MGPETGVSRLQCLKYMIEVPAACAQRTLSRRDSEEKKAKAKGKWRTDKCTYRMASFVMRGCDKAEMRAWSATERLGPAPRVENNSP